MSCCNECATGRPCGGGDDTHDQPGPCPPGHGIKQGINGLMICVPLTTSSPAVRECPPPKFHAAPINEFVDRCLARGLDDPGQIITTSLEVYYPRTPCGEPIPWEHLPSDAALCLHELRRVVAAQVELAIAMWRSAVARSRYEACSAAIGRQRLGKQSPKRGGCR